jgi:hypothetical protein
MKTQASQHTTNNNEARAAAQAALVLIAKLRGQK